jgi:hypothetical protein
LFQKKEKVANFIEQKLIAKHIVLCFCFVVLSIMYPMLPGSNLGTLFSKVAFIIRSTQIVNDGEHVSLALHKQSMMENMSH